MITPNTLSRTFPLHCKWLTYTAPYGIERWKCLLYTHDNKSAYLQMKWHNPPFCNGKSSQAYSSNYSSLCYIRNKRWKNKLILCYIIFFLLLHDKYRKESEMVANASRGVHFITPHWQFALCWQFLILLRSEGWCLWNNRSSLCSSVTSEQPIMLRFKDLLWVWFYFINFFLLYWWLFSGGQGYLKATLAFIWAFLHFRCPSRSSKD